MIKGNYVVKSKKRCKDHVTILINAASMESLELTVEEIKKAIRKGDRHTENGLSYEIYCHITSA